MWNGHKTQLSASHLSIYKKYTAKGIQCYWFEYLSTMGTKILSLQNVVKRPTIMLI